MAFFVAGSESALDELRRLDRKAAEQVVLAKAMRCYSIGLQASEIDRPPWCER